MVLPNKTCKGQRYSLPALNTAVKKYCAKDIEAFFKQQDQHISHVLVAHTRFHAYGKTKQQLGELARASSRDLRHALNHFGRLLYPSAQNKVRRNPYRYRPLTIVTLEGARETTNPALTLHFNICLGNLPTLLTTDDIRTLFTHAWHIQAHQSDNVMAYDYTVHPTKTWLGYQLKEAQQQPTSAWETSGVWDVENCWIPHAAFRAD